ncbi:L,D-transpeptidase family protein [uncultured Flavobacterium sp.]|uniref:L,D-transpeptidase family protein n=1 Tax=uncultured Flavobacterium sp. TaxID=165435 RepID=UPI0030C87346
MNRKKYSLLLFITLFFLHSCKEKVTPTKVSNFFVDQDSIDQIIKPEFLEKENDGIKELYASFDNKIIWNDDKNRKTLIDFIKKSEEDGLFPEDYYLKEIDSFERNRSKINYSDFQTFDLLLSNGFKNLADDLHKGKLNPRDLYNDWDLPYKSPIKIEKIIEAIQKNEVNDLLIDVSVKNKLYTDLKEGLKSILKKSDYNFPKTVVETKIVANDSSKTIQIIKQKLVYWNDLNVNNGTLIYDTETVKAIKKFQQRNGLSPDGVIGKGTVDALNYSKEKRIEQLKVNLERWKWFPEDFGENYIFINIPEYKLHFVYENDTVETKRIVVGKPSRKTPILTSKINNLVFNPTWTVPPTILKEDLVPSASRNISYFTRNRITILNSRKDTIKPKDWNSKNYKSYRYVQSPGYNNSLGLVKFNFPNKYMVYLHDTNHRDYFSRSYRALSSGCVRIEEPLPFAKTILMKDDEEFWKESEIDTIIKKAKTKVVPIKINVKVFQLYYTSWVEKSQIMFCPDIYKLDDELYEKLRNKSSDKS